MPLGTHEDVEGWWVYLDGGDNENVLAWNYSINELHAELLMCKKFFEQHPDRASACVSSKSGSSGCDLEGYLWALERAIEIKRGGE